MTTIDQRDSHIIQLVSHFHQLTTAQINELAFADSTSPMPCHRALRRMLAQDFLMRVEHRLIGGQRGGSGQYVYQLGWEGYRQYGEGPFRPWTTVNLHTLAIADVYVALVHLERQGLLSILEYQTEPDCHTTVGRYDLKPDLYVDLERVTTDKDRNLKIWFEVDRGTERPIRIRTKLERYWHARQVNDITNWPIWPVIVWLVDTEKRATELRRIVSKGPEEARRIFRVMTMADFIASF